MESAALGTDVDDNYDFSDGVTGMLRFIYDLGDSELTTCPAGDGELTTCPAGESEDSQFSSATRLELLRSRCICNTRLQLLSDKANGEVVCQNFG